MMTTVGRNLRQKTSSNENDCKVLKVFLFRTSIFWSEDYSSKLITLWPAETKKKVWSLVFHENMIAVQKTVMDKQV